MCEGIRQMIDVYRVRKIESTETLGYVEILKKHDELINMLNEEKPIDPKSVKDLAEQILHDGTQNTNERQRMRSILLFWSGQEMNNGREGIYESLPPLKPLR